MESLLFGSSRKLLLPLPINAKFCSQPIGSHLAAHACKCKVFCNAKKLCLMPMRIQIQRPHLKQIPTQRTDKRILILNSKHSPRHAVHSALQNSLESEPSRSPWKSVMHVCDTFYRFSRPHTVIGTALSIISVSLLAVKQLSDISPLFFTGVAEAVVAALLMNIYIVGLNQISDVEIDKVNKPYLPLASGEYSVTTAVIIVSSFAILSLGLGSLIGSWPLLCALSVSFVLGTAYSIDLPFLRWKRFAVVAAMCILAVRAVIVQIAFYLHVQIHVFGRPAIFSKPVIFATAFMSFFSVVIALFKDIPDIIGDKIYGIQSFTVRLGQERVFWICISLLEMAYAIAFLVGATSSCHWSKWTTVIGHSFLGLLLWNRAKSNDLKSKSAITSFYMFIWQLFYAEYLLIPLVRRYVFVALQPAPSMELYPLHCLQATRLIFPETQLIFPETQLISHEPKAPNCD